MEYSIVNVQNFTTPKILKMRYLRYTKHYAKTSTTLCGLDQETFFSTDPLCYWLLSFLQLSAFLPFLHSTFIPLLSLFLSFFLFLFSFFLCLSLAFAVLGVALPWYFPFTKSYWCGGSTSKEEAVDDDKDGELKALVESRDDTAGEKKYGIRVRNLRKVFGNKCGRDATRYKVAVKGISMEMAENEIFVLLGHNGAGKSTTISMLTGKLCCLEMNISKCGGILFPFHWKEGWKIER